MKSYNKSNYDRYKDDIYDTKVTSFRDGVIVKHLYLVEKIARKFSTSQIASGVLSIEDIIQEGNLGLIRSVDKVDWDKNLSAFDNTHASTVTNLDYFRKYLWKEREVIDYQTMFGFQ